MLIPHLILMDVPIRRLSAGETLLQEGTTGASAFVLGDGEVSISIEGREIACIGDRGTIFGEMSSLLGRPRGASVKAMRDSEFYVIEDLNAFLAKDRELSLILLKLLADRIEEMNAQLTEKRRWWQIF